MFKNFNSILSVLYISYYYFICRVTVNHISVRYSPLVVERDRSFEQVEGSLCGNTGNSLVTEKGPVGHWCLDERQRDLNG